MKKGERKLKYMGSESISAASETYSKPWSSHLQSGLAQHPLRSPPQSQRTDRGDEAGPESFTEPSPAGQVLHPSAVLQAAEPVFVVRPAIGDLGWWTLSCTLGRTQAGRKLGVLGTEVLLVAFCRGPFLVPSVDLGAEVSGAPLGGIGGLRAGGGATGRPARGRGPWLEVVLGRCGA